MTDPVVPTQPGGAFPPPNAGGPAFPPPNAGAPGFPPPNAGETPGAVPPVVPPQKKTAGKKILSIVGTLLIIVVVAALKFGLGSLFAKDPTGDAKAGDCLAVKSALTETTTEVEAELTECSASDAKFTVLGRVDGVKDTESTACDATFDAKLKEGESGYVIGSEESGGYLLCLKDNG